jgi:hypothetical protein
MADFQRFFQRNSRRLLGVGAILFSLMLFTLMMGSGADSTAWMVNQSVPAGAKLTGSMLTLEKVDLGDDASHYFTKSDNLVGQYAQSNLASGDLISTTQVTRTASASGIAYLPIGVLATDISTDIVVGDYVDLYVIPKDSTTAPALVLSHIYVESVDDKSRSLGGSVEIALALNKSDALIVVQAEAAGRLVVANGAL